MEFHCPRADIETNLRSSPTLMRRHIAEAFHAARLTCDGPEATCGENQRPITDLVTPTQLEDRRKWNLFKQRGIVRWARNLRRAVVGEFRSFSRVRRCQGMRWSASAIGSVFEFHIILKSLVFAFLKEDFLFFRGDLLILHIFPPIF